MIFDCCHSGSATRKGTRLFRSIDITEPVPKDLDKEICQSSRTRATKVSTGFLYTGLRSHVLLAACAPQEKAREDNGRGAFTQALLKTLRSLGTERLSYSDLVARLPRLEE